MFNQKSLKVPNYSSLSFSHKTKDKIFFIITEDDLPPTENTVVTKNDLTINGGTEILVLEHGIGYRHRYSKVIFDDKVGYVFTNGIEPLKDTKPFFNLSKNDDDYPNINVKEIDWRKQEPFIVYRDDNIGSYVLHYEFVEITSFSKEEELLNFMSVAREKGTEIILKNAGKKSDTETVFKLLNDYYLFSTAEEWYIEPRSCSTLRVAISIPYRYINAESVLLVENRETVQDESQTSSTQDTPDENRYFTISFKEYTEYNNFFDKIIEKLENFNLTYKTRKWAIEPESVTVDFSLEANNIKKFVSSINNLIKQNYPQFVIQERPDIFTTPKEKWSNSLDLVIDKENRSLVTIKYYNNNNNKRYSLVKEYSNFLRAEEAINKTTINYIFNFDPEKDSLQLDKKIQYIFTGDQEEDIRDFLKEKHYPQIINISPLPADLYNCTVDTVQRISDLKKFKLPTEIKKYELINKKYEANKKKKEADLFIRSLTDLTSVKDKNFRILFGIDPPPGKTSSQQLNNYVVIAKSLDWARFIGLATQCLSKNLPPEAVAGLLQKYQEARKFIEKMFLANACNPYLKNGLKVINGFELPVLSTYNPNKTLADEIEKAVVKLLNDLLAEGIKQALKAAASACLGNASSNADNNTGSNLGALDDANLNDPAIGGLLDDFAGGLNSPYGINREDAKEKLKNILSDISTCLSSQEMCKLYKGETLNDEVYQLISSLINRKYSSPYADKFNNKSYIIHFFYTLGTKIDLSTCDDILAPELPVPTTNILCDTGAIYKLRKDLLADKDIPPELIDDLLGDIKDKEAKNLEDILKILNSDNPFDFSKAPDLGCKIFPNGETLGPSPESFSKVLNTMFNSVYSTFDREAEEWYKTTYSVSSSKPNVLNFNQTTGELEIADIQVRPEQTNTIKANSGKSDPDTQATDSTGSTGAEENKLPSYIFKQQLQLNSSDVLSYNTELEDNKYILLSSSLNGYRQQVLDTAIITEELRKSIKEGEGLLSLFCMQVLLLIQTKSLFSIISLGTDPDQFNIQELTNFIKVLDVYARSNIADSQDLTIRLDNMYERLGLDSSQEANALFAAEEGAAVYLKVCEQIANNQGKLLALIGEATKLNSSDSLFVTSNYDLKKGSVKQLLEDVLTKYGNIKTYYKTVLKTKVLYPDYDLEYSIGKQEINLRNAIDTTVYSYYNNNLYHLDEISIKRNDKTYIKISQANKVKEEIKHFITSSDGLNIENLSNISKESLFKTYIDKKIDQYGSFYGLVSSLVATQRDSSEEYSYINSKIYDGIKNNIKTNKFLFLKDALGLGKSSISEQGKGQPYTQYLQLVIPQTPEQKACNIRPHYLDIDSIKNDISNEKQNNVCVEKIVDEKVQKNLPVNNTEIQKMETSSTQKTMLRGAYRLALRTFLHDILLRSIAVFGYYDPQSLRAEKNFIEFVSDIAESEIRGMDNTFFALFTDFLLKAYKEENPEEEIINETIKKKLLFIDAVGDELSNYVLPKLAKRIDVDTNFKLTRNVPPDNPIKLTNIYEDLFNLGILTIKENSVYIALRKKLLMTNNIQIGEKTVNYQVVEQKIFEAQEETNTLYEFLNSPDAKFLFEYIFPVTKYLNYFFMINCLSTSTRKQIIQSFRDTKKDIIRTCKIIHTNGQPLAVDPNNAQSVADINIADIMFKFIIKALIKTPTSIIKGVAESSEPNIAIISTGYKFAKALKPDLTSFVIPAASIPLGTIPTPITCPLPYLNPILAGVYFGTLAWYDDTISPIDQALQNLENNLLGKKQIVCDKDTKNNDQYYIIDNSPIQQGDYKLQYDGIFSSNDKLPYPETTPEQIKNELKEQVIEEILNDDIIKNISSINEEQKRSIIILVIGEKISSKYDPAFSAILNECRQKIVEEEKKLTAEKLLIDFIKSPDSGLTFSDSISQEDETQASYKGGVYLDTWIFAGKPSKYLAFEQILDTKYQEFIEKQIILSGEIITSFNRSALFIVEKNKPGQSFKEWIRQQFPGIKFYGE